MAFGLKLTRLVGFPRSLLRGAQNSSAPRRNRRRSARRGRTVGHHDLLDRKPKALSGGQRQRVALGRANRAASGGVFDGRAALQPRCQTARADARRTDKIAPAIGRHDDLRHARSGRGDDDGPTHRRDARRRFAAVRHARSRSTISRATSSLPASSARPR